jgi:hypothetical protein
MPTATKGKLNPSTAPAARPSQNDDEDKKPSSIKEPPLSRRPLLSDDVPPLAPLRSSHVFLRTSNDCPGPSCSAAD